MTVKELLSRTESAELGEWMAYETIEPFGESRADLRAGIIASTVNNCLTTNAMPAADFMPTFEPDEPASTAEQIEFVRRYVRRWG